MLQAIRDRVTGLVAIVILGLLAIPFIFVGLESYIQRVPEDAVAIVGEDKITTTEFQTSFAQYRANLRQQQGDAYDEIATNQPIVRREHLEGMIDQLLLRQHADTLGLAVSDQAILDIILEIPAFQVDGQFNQDQYRQVLRASGRIPRVFEQELREDLLVNALPSSLSASATPTEAEIDQIIRLRQQTRDLVYTTIAPADFEEQVEITEADVEQFYADNPNDFRTQEQVRLSWIELSADDFRDELGLSEEELRQRYEAASQRYLTPEAREAAHILITAGQERSNEEAAALAAEIRQRLLDGEDFSALAMEYSDDPGSAAQGGDLGLVERDQMVEAFESALFALSEPGEISEVVESRFGWHVIRLGEIREPQGMSFEEARDEILAEYVDIESERLYEEQSERLIDLIYADDSSLEPLAEALGVEIQTGEPITRMGGVAPLSNPQVVEAAFSDRVLLDGAVSDPIEYDENRSIVIKLEEHLPSVVRPLEEVSDGIRERLRLEGAADLARARADALLARIESGEVASFETLAEEEGLTLETVEAMGRFDFEQGLDFVREVFRLPRPAGESVYDILDKGRDFALVRLDAVVDGDPAAASEAERSGAAQQLRFIRSDYEIAGLVEYLRSNTEIEVMEERL
ncbi:SurA N-terminal domain-containing protein [Wenzhouxiangella marina]|uniref:Periplasmic chaperone PpiD n=1 Tax=Wenzhouxiangella marina TaxID=1579979 RepID=A0A0K0XVI7_9GAMM|nr:SurA N-terminal domain-containing protein [Wenzhouxiangella marina]AKS41641.1 hypothetical protein WM2015_1267 [Wenzhouxiangella marina]MBB6086599.1 peptidyl-prolyl cis-trans isomerase D [Wenzhouxiangella marina]